MFNVSYRQDIVSTQSAGAMLYQVIHLLPLSCKQESVKIYNQRCSMQVLKHMSLIPDIYALNRNSMNSNTWNIRNFSRNPDVINNACAHARIIPLSSMLACSFHIPFYIHALSILMHAHARNQN